MNNLGYSLRNLSQALEAAGWGGSVSVPFESQSFVAAIGKGLGALADFADDLSQSASQASNIEHLLREEALVRKDRDAQMRLEFDGEREQLKAIIEAQSEILAAQTRLIKEQVTKLDRALVPIPASASLVAAAEALELLRQTSSDGAPRELVEVLRKLDGALSEDHITRAARELDRLRRVVGEVEDLLEEADPGDESLRGLREALEEARAE